MRELSGKVAVVTGAGAGIGRSTSLRLADAGCAVAVCDVDGSAAEITLEMIEARGATGSAHVVDVADEAAMRALVDAVLLRHGTVDIVVNNAGVAVAAQPSTEVALDRFAKVMDINFWGCVHGSLLFVPHLLGRPEASLVNVGSNAALFGYGQLAPYSASKFAVRGFTEALRMELQGSPVRVTLVCPGATRTQIMANSPAIDAGKRDAIQANLARVPAASPERVADAIVRAIRRGRPRVLIGADSRALDVIVRALPGTYSRLLARPVQRLLERQLTTNQSNHERNPL